MTTPTLWHFTCKHGRADIGGKGKLVPPESLVSAGARADVITLVAFVWQYVWLTDNADGSGAGLELWPDSVIQCDRLAHRYRVTRGRQLTRWVDLSAPDDIRAALETSSDALRPETWWVSRHPVAVVYDPTLVTA